MNPARMGDQYLLWTTQKFASYQILTNNIRVCLLLKVPNNHSNGSSDNNWLSIPRNLKSHYDSNSNSYFLSVQEETELFHY